MSDDNYDSAEAWRYSNDAAQFGSMVHPPPYGSPYWTAYYQGLQEHENIQRRAQDVDAWTRANQSPVYSSSGSDWGLNDFIDLEGIEWPKIAWKKIISYGAGAAFAAAIGVSYYNEVGLNPKGLYWAPQYLLTKFQPMPHKHFNEKTLQSIVPGIGLSEVRRVTNDFNFIYRHNASLGKSNPVELHGYYDVYGDMAMFNGKAEYMKYNNDVRVVVPGFPLSKSGQGNVAIVYENKPSYQKGWRFNRLSDYTEVNLDTGAITKKKVKSFCSEYSLKQPTCTLDDLDTSGIFGPVNEKHNFQYRPRALGSLYNLNK